jgi:membrane associated rhomboid family serine protease
MPRTPAINLPPIVLWLSAGLAAVHAGRQFLSGAADEWVLLAFAFIPARYSEAGAMLPGGEAAWVWSPVSYALLHADIVHLLVNVVWMASFGGALARRFGTLRFLVLSIASAVAGAGVHYGLHPQEVALVIGASGAVSGMMAASARFAFAPGGPLAGGGAERSYDLPAIPLLAVLRNSRAMSFILIWFAVNLLFGLAGGDLMGVEGPIAWEAHVGGFIAGLLLFGPLDPVRTHKSDPDGTGMITPDS